MNTSVIEAIERQKTEVNPVHALEKLTASILREDNKLLDILIRAGHSGGGRRREAVADCRSLNYGKNCHALPVSLTIRPDASALSRYLPDMNPFNIIRDVRP
jgi:hypothetical protein